MVRIIDIELFDKSLGSLVKTIIQTSRQEFPRDNRCISPTSAHGLVFAKRNKKFAGILKSFYFRVPDGMPSVWVGKLKGAHSMERCYGPDLFEKIISESSELPINHFLLGGREGIVEELKRVCENKFSNMHICGIYRPPFRPLDENELHDLVKHIDSLRTDIVWIGISTPAQELLAIRLAQQLHVHFIITVGAAFDFHTGRTRKAPRVIQAAGLEWLFRLCNEPRRLYKRYFTAVPLFILYNLIDLINGGFCRTKKI